MITVAFLTSLMLLPAGLVANDLMAVLLLGGAALVGLATGNILALLQLAAPEDEAVRILVTMKADEAGSILETLSKISKVEAKHAASLTGRMRSALPPAAGARPKSSP